MVETNNGEIKTKRNRKLRTPITEASNALWQACEYFVWVMLKLNNSVSADVYENNFFEELFTTAFDDPETDGDSSVEIIGTLHKEAGGQWDNGDESCPLAKFEVMLAIIDYAVQAMKAQKNDDSNLAWSYVADAKYWSGILTAEFARGLEPSEMSQNGRKAVEAKLANDPKQLAKKEIEQIYQANKTQFKRRGYSAQFIREMHAKYPIFESQKTIENLVSALNKENKDIPR
jgi:hypothetical protein